MHLYGVNGKSVIDVSITIML